MLNLALLLIRFSSLDNHVPFKDNMLMSWMGWSKLAFILVTFPVLAASPESQVVLKETTSSTSLNVHSAPSLVSRPNLVSHTFNGPVVVVAVPGDYPTHTVTETVTVTSINDTPPLPTPTVSITLGSKPNMCDAKHGGGWATGYLFSSWVNLFYCDRFPTNTQYFKGMACSAFSQMGVGFSLGAINNVVNACHDVKYMDLSTIQGTSFVGLGTATFFKLYGCAHIFRTVDGLSKCNEVSDHSINAFTSICATVITR